MHPISASLVQNTLCHLYHIFVYERVHSLGPHFYQMANSGINLIFTDKFFYCIKIKLAVYSNILIFNIIIIFNIETNILL